MVGEKDFRRRLHAPSFTGRDVRRASNLCGGSEAGVVLNQTQQFFVRIWLTQVVVDAQFHRMLAVLFSDARGDHDDGQITQGAICTDVPR
ncbi:hypothetical protein D3C72_2155320 [compost metagenome]